MRKETDNRFDSFIRAQITEIDFIYDYKIIILSDLSFEDFVLNQDKHFSLENDTDKWYYLKHILPRLKLLYFDGNRLFTMQYLMWASSEHRQLVMSGEYNKFYRLDNKTKFASGNAIFGKRGRTDG